jgi:CubicO group peptidase (beta-lactamase class C family)
VSKVAAVMCAVVLVTAAGQARQPVDRARTDSVRDQFVALYNNLDFTAIHRLSSPAFAAKIREEQLVRFLENNLSTGRILAVSPFRTVGTAVHYRLECEARTMLLVLDVTSDGRIDSLGLADFPQPRLALPPAVPTSNPRLTVADLAIDDAAREYFRQAGAAGLSIGLVRDGRAVTYHYGETSHGGRRLPDDRTVYQLESVTKTFTATLLARAVVDGKVSLDDDVRQHLPGTYPGLEVDGQPVTLRSLANHSSGLPRTPTNLLGRLHVERLTPMAGYTDAQLIEGLESVTLKARPGTRAEYSNLGMDVLAFVIERAYRETYAELLQRVITRPLGMTQTGVGTSHLADRQLAVPYGANGRAVPYDRGRAGAGGIVSTTADMLAYIEAQIHEDRPEILLTHQQTVGTTGLGWGVRTVDGIRDLQHSGSGVGFRANVTVYPDARRGLVVLMNHDSSDDTVDRLVSALQRIALQQ